MRPHAQVDFETHVHSFLDHCDEDTNTEFCKLIKNLREKLPSRPPAKAAKRAPRRTPLPAKKSCTFADLLHEQLRWQQDDNSVTVDGLDEFIVGIVGLVNVHGDTLLKKANKQGYDTRAVVAMKLFQDHSVMVEDENPSAARMVQWNGKTYYDTHWLIKRVSCCFVCVVRSTENLTHKDRGSCPIFLSVFFFVAVAAPLRHVWRIRRHGRWRQRQGQ